jgi:hypothetical protein
MANKLEYVRSKLQMRKTGKGTELTITLNYVPGDKPFITVNGNPCVTDGEANFLAASRFILQLVEEFKLAVDREHSLPRMRGAFTPEVISTLMAMLERGSTVEDMVEAVGWGDCYDPLVRIARFVEDVAEARLGAKVSKTGRGETAVYRIVQ